MDGFMTYRSMLKYTIRSDEGCPCTFVKDVDALGSWWIPSAIFWVIEKR
jgi:hypothetical protein